MTACSVAWLQWQSGSPVVPLLEKPVVYEVIHIGTLRPLANARTQNFHGIDGALPISKGHPTQTDEELGKRLLLPCVKRRAIGRACAIGLAALACPLILALPKDHGDGRFQRQGGEREGAREWGGYFASPLVVLGTRVPPGGRGCSMITLGSEEFSGDVARLPLEFGGPSLPLGASMPLVSCSISNTTVREQGGRSRPLARTHARTHARTPITSSAAFSPPGPLRRKAAHHENNSQKGLPSREH